MTKSSKVKLSAEEELEKLNAFHADQVRSLQPRLEEERQAQLEEARKAEETRLAATAEEIKPLAIYCLDLAERADRALEDARLALIERQQVAGEIAQKSSKFPDRVVDARLWHYERQARSGLNCNGLLKFLRIDHHADGQNFVSQDVRALSRWIDADQMKRASA